MPNNGVADTAADRWRCINVSQLNIADGFRT